MCAYKKGALNNPSLRYGHLMSLQLQDFPQRAQEQLGLVFLPSLSLVDFPVFCLFWFVGMPESQVYKQGMNMKHYVENTHTYFRIFPLRFLPGFLQVE